jgi:hypothetical protein
MSRKPNIENEKFELRFFSIGFSLDGKTKNNGVEIKLLNQWNRFREVRGFSHQLATCRQNILAFGFSNEGGQVCG